MEIDTQSSSTKPKKPKHNPVQIWLRGFAGAVAGALAGYFLFDLLLDYGLYAGVVPGAFVGLGFGLAARQGNLVAGVLCGIIGLVFGFWCDAATNHPPEDLVSYFQTFDQVPLANKMMVVIGGFVSYWFGKGQN